MTAMAGAPRARCRWMRFAIRQAEVWIPPAAERILSAEEWIPPAEEWIPPAQEWIPPAEEWIPPAEEWIPPAGWHSFPRCGRDW